MERAEKLALGAAVAGHAVLFGLLSVGFLATPNPLKLAAQPIDISLVPDVAIEQTSPMPAAEPAPSVAPEEGAPEDAAPPEPAEAEPAPAPEPAPPAKPAPPRPAPKPVPVPAPRPAPAPKPVAQPKPVPERPTPAAEKAAPTKPTPSRQQAASAPAKAAPAKSVATPATQAKPTTAARGQGGSPTATAARARGSRLGDDFLKGLSDKPSPSRAEAAPAARMGAQEMANIASVIGRQIQPCANRQVNPGPGASSIRVNLNLRLNRDGSLAARPRVVGHVGVDDDNGRYVDRVDDLAIASVVGCAPFRGLPDELYDVQRGWSNFTFRYKLPG